MKLRVLGSSSSGNCYLLQGDRETLILEAGIKMRHILQALNFSLSNVAGCLISHRHGDHSIAAYDLQKYGVNIFAHEDVRNAEKTHLNAFYTPIEPGTWYVIGQFKVRPLKMIHTDSDGKTDCPCLGFIIKHPEMGNLLFATDTVLVPTNIVGLNHIMIESNYCDAILQENIDNGLVTASERSRLERSHMELEITKRFLQGNDLSQVNEIILLHLSSRNSDPEMFRDVIASATGEAVYVAKGGLEIELSNTPY